MDGTINLAWENPKPDSVHEKAHAVAQLRGALEWC